MIEKVESVPEGYVRIATVLKPFGFNSIGCFSDYIDELARCYSGEDAYSKARGNIDQALQGTDFEILFAPNGEGDLLVFPEGRDAEAREALCDVTRKINAEFEKVSSSIRLKIDNPIL